MSLSPVSVLHLNTESQFRGGQVQTELLARGLPGEGVVVAGDSELHRRLIVQKTPCFPVRSRLDIHRVIRRLKPSLIAAHTHKDHLLCCRPPVVVHRRVDFAPSALRVRTYRFVAGVIAVSRAVKRVLRRSGVVAPIEVVADAVDLQTFALHPPSEEDLVVCVGALVHHKGHDLFLEAMANIPHTKAVIVGEGPQRARLTNQIERLGLQHRIKLVGQQPALPFQLRAKVICHPSRTEGRGQAAIEAAALGRPIVSTWAGGLAESVGTFAVLTPPGQSPPLRRRLQLMLHNKGLRQFQVQRAQKHRLSWGLRHLWRQTEVVYRQLLCGQLGGG